MAKSSFPKQIMPDVIWVFDAKPFATEADCTAAVTEYLEDVSKRMDKRGFTWDPEALVLKSPTVRIRHERWGDDEEEGEAESVMHFFFRLHFPHLFPEETRWRSDAHWLAR